MDHHRDSNLYDEHDTTEYLDATLSIRNAPRQRPVVKQSKKPGHKPKRDPQTVKAELAAQPDNQSVFDFSYHASRHEREWIVGSLGGFYEDHWLDDVLRLLKGGKEANVYQCAANANSLPGEDYLAAKIYRPRQFRNLKNDHIYREGRPNLDSEGRIILDDNMKHAMQKRTRYGLELLHSSWLEHEFQTMLRLHTAGADVPAPYARCHNAILMGYIGYDDLPAPALQEISLSPLEAKHLFERVVHNLDLMLQQERIHGDLSAFNILYLDGEITLIDFPQAINPYENRNALRIFERDVTRVCEYFARQGLRTNSHQLATDLWHKHGHRLSPEVHPRLLDDQSEQDRQLWQRLQQD
jgi:RIO kinase 1